MGINILLNSLSRIDIFGQNITLNMNKNSSYTTAFGGFSSILIILLFSLIFFSNIVQFFGKDNVFYDSEIAFSNDPELMEMNDGNSMIALAIDQTNFTLNPFFNITVEQKINFRNKNGSLIKETIEVPMQPCTLERFNNIFQLQGIDFTDQFNFLGMNKMLCPKQIIKLVKFKIQLYFLNGRNLFKRNIQILENNSQEFLWNPTCGSQEDKAKYLATNAQFKLQIFQINTVVNPLKPRNYKSVFIDSDMYFSFVPFKLARLANVFYRQFIVNNDERIQIKKKLLLEKLSLSRIDIFGQNITLNMNKNSSYTTAFGGFSSILIILLFSLIFFSNIVQFFGKDNVFYDSEIAFSNDPELMEMNDGNSMIALAIDQTNFTLNPFFNITVEQKINFRNKNGSLIKETIEVPMQPCTLERFNNIFQLQGIDFTDQFNFLGMNKMLCPKSNFTFQMEGTYSSETFKFLKITVKNCKISDTNSNSLWNPTCGSQEDKAKYLATNAQFKLQIFQINTVVNPLKPRNYKSVFIDSDMYFSFVPFKLARLANVFYRQFIVNNDESIMPYQNIDQEKVIVRKAEDFRDLTELGRDKDDNYAIVYLRRSPFTETINRKFQKIGELLSYLGGFMQIMKLLFGFAIAFYNRTSMLIELANKLYDFQDAENLKKLYTLKTLKNTDQIGSDLGKQELNSVNPFITSQQFQKVEWKQQIKELVKKSKPISFNFRIFINQLTFGYLCKNKNSEFLEKAMNKINKELDLHSILYQLQEINKLKSVLLRKSQIILFNFTPKPIVTLGKDQIVPSRYLVEDLEIGQSYIKSKEDNLNEELFIQLEEAYKEIVEEVEKTQSNICQMNINLKLTQLIGSQVKHILKPCQQQCKNELQPNEIQSINNNQEEQNLSD
ncbi:unnamed protein product [Paramecium sonneborni]|uniref:Transmembrane protein n=1 Tax=Paramecium sonneborni TaxID=65129 RepID=A0A8S1QLN3_9CILI|nr:unnamed protein product [Paramecium sonneborni]